MGALDECTHTLRYSWADCLFWDEYCAVNQRLLLRLPLSSNDCFCSAYPLCYSLEPTAALPPIELHVACREPTGLGEIKRRLSCC